MSEGPQSLAGFYWRLLPCPCQLPVASGVPGLWQPHSDRCLHLHTPPPLCLVPSSYKGASLTGLRANLLCKVCKDCNRVCLRLFYLLYLKRGQHLSFVPLHLTPPGTCACFVITRSFQRTLCCAEAGISMSCEDLWMIPMLGHCQRNTRGDTHGLGWETP